MLKKSVPSKGKATSFKGVRTAPYEREKLKTNLAMQSMACIWGKRQKKLRQCQKKKYTKES